MINKIMKKFLVLTIAILAVFSVSAQGKYGAYEQKCKENLSMFREYYKQKNYDDAYNPWRWAYVNCPQSSGNIFKNAPKILKAKMKADKANKSAYVDTLMMVFDDRIKYFGKEGYVLGIKGYELIFVDKSRSEEALGYLKKSIDLDGNNASVQAVYGLMLAIVNLEKLGLKTKLDVIEAYTIVSEIIDYNIKNESKSTKYYMQYSEKVENKFTPYANCDDLIALFSVKFDHATEDINLLKRITKVLDNKKCTDSDLFFNASSRLYELEPSAASANQMSKMSIVRGKPSNAITFAKQAIKLEEDENQKAIYYLGLADAYRSAGSFSSARGAVYNALELRARWGEAYMNLGNIYVAGAKNCGNDFDKSTVYWVAVDAFKQALSDSETKDRASKSINTYSKYFPTKENCFFNGVTAGGKHTVACWINKKTTARTSD
jgi:tetratricopeptide (TPR) repeat protein